MRSCVSSARVEQRHVSFTLTAQQHVRREKAWWLANRDHPEVFAEELEQALKVVAMLPGAGALYASSPIPCVRRAYLRRIALTSTTPSTTTRSSSEHYGRTSRAWSSTRALTKSAALDSRSLWRSWSACQTSRFRSVLFETAASNCRQDNHSRPCLVSMRRIGRAA